MKKITLLLLMLWSCINYAQLNEDFESAFPPTGWTTSSVVGGSFVWEWSPAAITACSGTKGAYINNENIGQGNTEQDWLITKQVTVPTDGQLRFLVRQFQIGDVNTKFRVMITTGAQTDLASYQLAKAWTEAELNDFDDGDVTDCDLRTVEFANTFFGQQVYIAFVREYTQPTPARTGERFLIDNVSLVQQCQPVTDLTVGAASCSGAPIGWTAPAGQTNFQVLVIPEGNPINEAFAVPVTGTTYTPTTLLPSTVYSIYVRTDCGDNNFSAWVGPLNFTTIPAGSLCSCPIPITTCPAQFSGSTQDYGDDFDTIQSPAAGSLCGAVPATVNYMAGPEVVYAFTATADQTINLWMDPVQSNSGVFVYSSCADIGVNCIAGAANNNANPRTFNFDVTTGNTYYIVISSTAAVTNVVYDLVLQCVTPPPPPCVTIAPPACAAVTNLTATSATLNWSAGATASGAYTSWNIVVQPASSPVPTGGGTLVTGAPTYNATSLTGGIAYEYWIQGICTDGSGQTSVWYGPCSFTTPLCNDADKCTYTFRMTDSANNGWNGARMQIVQNNAVIATIGSTYNAGAGPIDVAVQLCPGQPFSVFWSVAGTQPQQCILTILNSASQAIFLKPAGASGVNQTVYSGVVSAACADTTCNTFATGLTISGVFTTSLTASWTSPGVDTWDVYVAPTGGPAPDDATTPTYDDITSNPFSTIVPLTPDTPYDVCVRVQCDFTTPDWVCTTVTTLPTCPKPTNPTVTNITLNSADFGWTPGTPTDSQWEILIIPGWPNAPAPPGVNPAVGTIYPVSAAQVGAPPGPYTFNIAGLTQATIYYYYIRTVCPGDDKSTWTGPVIFNTITCDAADKCTYKFVLTDLGSNGWNGARLQVRQNGIPITPVIGGTINGAGPTTVNISLCDDIPFDVFWQTAGTAPDEIGFTVQNPFTDIIYTYEPGTGTPGTVIWNSVTECDPPTCPKPTALSVNLVATTQTTAELTWIPGGSETQWEVYVVPVGGPLPVNGQPLADPTNTTDNYYVANAPLPFTVTGLLPGTNYIYYVRAICSGSDVSTWTILNPKTFTTKPVNDECTAAINVPVNPTRECVDDVSGSTVGATLSSQLAGCPGQEDDDVWYMFTATNDIHIITLSNVVGGGGDVNHTVYALAGPDCSTMTQLYCSNPNVSIANGLTPNNVYYIRVYSNGNTQTNAITFDLCITTPPDITNDDCSTAIVASVNEGFECVTTTPGTVTGATPSTGSFTNACAGSEDDDVWFQFTANGAKQIISLENIQGTSVNVNFQVFSTATDCSALTSLGCFTENQAVLNNTTEGAVYFIRLWSEENTLQDIVFDICIGKVPPPIYTSTTDYTITELVEDVFIDSDCALVSNITSSAAGVGYFNKANSEFALTEGIILTSGNVLAAPGPETGIQSFDNGNPADADLTALINQVDPDGGISSNVARLEFDFTPITNYIFFDFIFASDEYGTFQCSFSDFFAFFLTNTVTGETINMAVVPGTDDPVCTFTVRNNIFNTACTSENVEWFDYLYDDFLPGGTPAIVSMTDFRGITKKMIAEANVTPGTLYHMKIVLGDDGGFGGFDTAYDSAVFIQDFEIGDVELGVDLTVDNGNAICVGDEYTIQSGLDPVNYTFEWYNGTDLISGETGPNLTVTQPGAYTIKALFNNTSCQATDTVTIEYYQDALPGTPENLINCDASGSALFDLTENADNILAPFTAGTHTIAYFLNEDDASDNVNDIDDPTTFTGNDDQVIWVRVNNTATGCKQLISFTLTVQDLTPQFTLDGKLAICPDESTTLTVQPVAGNFDPTLVTYVWTGPSGTLPDTGQSITVVGATGYGSYSVLVNNQGCTATQTFDIIENTEEWTVSVNTPATLCPSESATIAVSIGNNTNGDPVEYTYTTPGGTPVVSASNSFVITGPGDYNVNVNILGCDTDYPFTVGTSTPAWAVSVTGNTPLCPDENGTVTATVANPPAGATITYTFTRPSGGDVTNTTGVLPVDEAGDYTVSVDIYGCPSTPQPFAIAEGAIDYTVSFVGEPYTICDNQSVLVSFTANNFDINDPLVSFTWIRPDGSTATGATISADQVGTYQLTIERLGCQAGPFPVNVGENNTTVTIGSDNSCENNVFLIRAIPVNNSFDPATATFEWTGTAPFQPGTEPWIIRVTEGGTYTVTITTPDGCKSIQPITENFVACGIQRGISPNGDGKNDTFDLSGYNVKKLTIFNRYGTQVYEYANYTNQWDGHSAGGETLPSATYFYVIETAEGDQLTGWIYINR